jgi:RNA polymerase sigma-70 factor (ECF subfamily)
MSGPESIRDALLVLRCQAGEAAAFAALVDRWQPGLLRHACRVLGDSSAAHDVVQETWLAVINGLPALDDGEAFGTWVFRIATNKCSDWIRRQQRGRRLIDRMAERTRAEEPESSAAQGRDRTLSVQEVMTTLPPEQHVALALFYFDGFSVREIAEITGTAPGTVKSRLFHGRKQLRRVLEDKDDESGQ